MVWHESVIYLPLSLHGQIIHLPEEMMVKTLKNRPTCLALP